MSHVAVTLPVVNWGWALAVILTPEQSSSGWKLITISDFRLQWWPSRALPPWWPPLNHGLCDSFPRAWLHIRGRCADIAYAAPLWWHTPNYPFYLCILFRWSGTLINRRCTSYTVDWLDGKENIHNPLFRVEWGLFFILPYHVVEHSSQRLYSAAIFVAFIIRR